MSLLAAGGISIGYGPDEILADVDFRVEKRQRIGLIGPNGCGKTSILRVLTGQLEPTRGSITTARGLRTGYLRQEDAVDPDKTVMQEAEHAFEPVLKMESRLRELEDLMSNSGGHQAAELLDEYSDLHERFDDMGGFQSLRDVPLVLVKLGFRHEDLDKTGSILSGGEKTRLALAKMLLLSPDLLFLDEPTNHLDLAAIEWLEEFLTGFGGSIVVVSHDRVFLDRVTTHIAEIEEKSLVLYAGNYSKFAQLKEERRERQAKEFEQRQAEIQKLDEYVRIHMGSQRTAQARGRLKMMNRLVKEGLKPPPGQEKMRLKMGKVARSGDVVAVWEGVGMRYGERELFPNVDLVVRLGDRVGIIGGNGSGKSTLIRILMGREEPNSGKASLGSNVTAGYFAQDNVDLDPDATVIDHIIENFSLSSSEARHHLGKFLFSGDDVFKPVGKLSGGEKNKLVLAQLFLINPNLLVLDEPTNHLDIASREALVRCLKEYCGTIIVVSHDRFLLSVVTTRTVEISDSTIKDFSGNYDEYRVRKAPVPAKIIPSVQPKAAELSAHQLSKERIKAKQALENATVSVHDAELAMKQLEDRLWSPGPQDNVIELSQRHEEMQARVARALADWEAAAEYAGILGVEV